MCFQALVGCFKPTTDSETLGKDPNWMFQFVKDKLIVVNRDEYVQTAKISPWELKIAVGVFDQSLGVGVWLKQPKKTEITLETLAFFGCLGVIVLDLDAEGDKFVANSGPETVEKT